MSSTTHPAEFQQLLDLGRRAGNEAVGYGETVKFTENGVERRERVDPPFERAWTSEELHHHARTQVGKRIALRMMFPGHFEGRAVNIMGELAAEGGEYVIVVSNKYANSEEWNSEFQTWSQTQEGRFNVNRNPVMWLMSATAYASCCIRNLRMAADNARRDANDARRDANDARQRATHAEQAMQQQQQQQQGPAAAAAGGPPRDHGEGYAFVGGTTQQAAAMASGSTLQRHRRQAMQPMSRLDLARGAAGLTPSFFDWRDASTWGPLIRDSRGTVALQQVEKHTVQELARKAPDQKDKIARGEALMRALDRMVGLCVMSDADDNAVLTNVDQINEQINELRLMTGIAAYNVTEALFNGADPADVAGAALLKSENSERANGRGRGRGQGGFARARGGGRGFGGRGNFGNNNNQGGFAGGRGSQTGGGATGSN